MQADDRASLLPTNINFLSTKRKLTSLFLSVDFPPFIIQKFSLNKEISLNLLKSFT